MIVGEHPRGAALLPLADAGLAGARPPALVAWMHSGNASSTSTRRATVTRGEDLGRSRWCPRRLLIAIGIVAVFIRLGVYLVCAAMFVIGRCCRTGSRSGCGTTSSALSARPGPPPGQVVDEPPRPRRVGAEREGNDREPPQVDDGPRGPVCPRVSRSPTSCAAAAATARPPNSARTLFSATARAAPPSWR